MNRRRLKGALRAVCWLGLAPVAFAQGLPPQLWNAGEVEAPHSGLTQFPILVAGRALEARRPEGVQVQSHRHASRFSESQRIVVGPNLGNPRVGRASPGWATQPVGVVQDLGFDAKRVAAFKPGWVGTVGSGVDGCCLNRPSHPPRRTRRRHFGGGASTAT